MKIGQKISIGIATIGAIGALVGSIYKMDKKEVEGWYSLTNTIPQMIAEGDASEARRIYEDAWRDINQRIRDSRRDPISFITPEVVDRLERDFTWEVLTSRAQNYKN